jgi:hypothetical protein
VKLLGGLCGTLVAILALTWAVQGDAFILNRIVNTTVSQIRVALWPRRPADAPDGTSTVTVAPGDSAVPSPTAPAQLDRPKPLPNPAPARGRDTSTGPVPRIADAAPPAGETASAIEPRTDGRERIITVTRRGPIVARPGQSGPPLLVVTEGTGLKLLDIEGEWFKVEFFDRTRGPRVGYIQVEYVRAVQRPPRR